MKLELSKLEYFVKGVSVLTLITTLLVILGYIPITLELLRAFVLVVGSFMLIQIVVDLFKAKCRKKSEFERDPINGSVTERVFVPANECNEFYMAIWFGSEETNTGLSLTPYFNLCDNQDYFTSQSFYVERELQELFEKLFSNHHHVHHFDDGTLASAIFPKGNMTAEHLLIIRREASLQNVCVHYRPTKSNIEGWRGNLANKVW